MAKKTVFINENHGGETQEPDRKLSSQDRRRIARWKKRMEYAKENGMSQGFKAIDDGPDYQINDDPMDKVDKALSTPFPRDVEKQEEEVHEDVMHRIVNHAHQRSPKKKWS